MRFKYRNDACIYGSDITSASLHECSLYSTPYLLLTLYHLTQKTCRVDRSEQETHCQPSTYTNNRVTFKELICSVTGHDVKFFFIIIIMITQIITFVSLTLYLQ